MTSLSVTTRNGNVVSVETSDALSVMEAIRAAGIDELEAICGGACSCATCHVYIDAAFLTAMPAMSADEDDLLDCSSHRRAESRLSCQLPASSAPYGLRLTIAPAE